MTALSPKCIVPPSGRTTCGRTRRRTPNWTRTRPPCSKRRRSRHTGGAVGSDRRDSRVVQRAWRRAQGCARDRTRRSICCIGLGPQDGKFARDRTDVDEDLATSSGTSSPFLPAPMIATARRVTGATTLRSYCTGVSPALSLIRGRRAGGCGKTRATGNARARALVVSQCCLAARTGTTVSGAVARLSQSAYN